MKIQLGIVDEYVKVEGLYPGQTVQVIAGNKVGESAPASYTAPGETAPETPTVMD